MTLSKTMKIGGAVAVTGAVVAKAINITVNDDWDSVMYSIKKEFRQVFVFDIMKDVKPSYKNQEVPKLPKVVILGTGWGAMSFLQNLDQDNLDITIVSPRSFFFYTPLLAGTAVGTVRNTSIIEPIRWHINRAGHSNASFVQATCSNVDATKQTVYGVDVRGDEIEIYYDYLVVAVGAEPATFNIPGVKEYACFMKEVDDGVKVQKRILERLEAASAILFARRKREERNQKESKSNSKLETPTPDQIETIDAAVAVEEEIRFSEDLEISRLLHWVVVGAGPTGVELCAEMSDFVREDVSRFFPLLSSRVKVSLVEASDKILGAFDERMIKYAHSVLSERGVKIQTGSAVTEVTSEYVEMKVRAAPSITIDGKVTPSSDPPTVVRVPYGSLVWAGGITSRPITKSIASNIGALQTSRFGLEVDKKLCVIGAPNRSVWALGDCAVSGCAPTAQSASQQGKYLGALFRDTNMDRAAMAAHPDFKFIDKGSLAYLGDGKGVAKLEGLWDTYPTTVGGQTVGRVVEGQPAFIIWKSLYFSKLLSSRNQAQVIFDWISTTLFGRDISTVHNIQATTVPKKVQIPDIIKMEILQNIQSTTVQTTDVAKTEIE